MTRTLVVGASGFLGHEVARLLEESGRDVVGTYHGEPTEFGTVEYDFWADDLSDLIGEFDPDEVAFVAAVERPDAPDESKSLSTFEERADIVARACADHRLHYMSSAAVFDGTEAPYADDAERSPRDGYGRRLVAFEDAVRAHCSDAIVFRTSYLYGFSNGRLDPRLARTRDTVTAGESVAYFDDMYKSPTEVTEAATAVTRLLDSDATGVVHAPAPRTTVFHFHRDAMRALGYDHALVERDSIPVNMDVSPDLTLESSEFRDLTGFEPSAVSDALE